ncbi:DNA polymerase zeta, partial [Teratosphaeriaceae sp. CCFEE 6253]
MAKPANLFRLRLNCIDHYQTSPTSFDPPLFGPSSLSSTQRNNVPHVPVIRVFGATETGQKVCAHVHGALPYLYLPYTESLDKDAVDGYIRTLKHSIDHALALSYRRNPYDHDPKKTTFVAHICLVKGVPFFGYHVGYSYYLKVYILNPAHMTRFTDLLQQGAIMARAFQPYEAHLQYLLQAMCDYNLYGCAYIEVQEEDIGWRGPVPTQDAAEEHDVGHLWHNGSISEDQILDAQTWPRQSHCQLEIDIRVEDILNRHEIRPRELHHSFIERLQSLENLPPEEKLVHSMAGLWRDETKRRRKRLGITDPSSSPYPPEVLVSMSADPQNTSDGGWIHEEDYRRDVNELAKQERKARGGGDLSFESFIGPKQVSEGVQTVLHSVEELFHERLAKKWSGKGEADRGSRQAAAGPNGVKEEDGPWVDMSSIAQLPPDESDHDSDEDMARSRALTQRRKLKDAGLDDAMGEAKVNGTSAEIERRAGQLDDISLPADTVQAVAQGQSLKRLAESASQGRFKRPKLHAQTEGERPQSRHVAFRARDSRLTAPLGAPGRVPDDEGTNQVPPSSQRFASRKPSNVKLNVPPSSRRSGDRTMQDEKLDGLPSGQAPRSSQRSSQGSQKDGLGFPVVKDPNDPDT